MNNTPVRKNKFFHGRIWRAALLAAALCLLLLGAGSGEEVTGLPNIMYPISACLLAAFLICLVIVVWNSRRASERKLKNIRYILDVEENVFQAPTDPDHFHTALKKAQEFLKAKRAFFWVEDELSSQQQRWWSGGEKEILVHGTQFQVVFPALLERLSTQGSFLCQKADLYIAPPEVRALSRELQTESLMMVAVKTRDGTPKGILGAVDLPGHLKDAELLEQVVLSFSMALDQHEAYRRINQIGHTDSMTDLLNWNGFHEDLVALKGRSLSSLACVYADANGLHEINNRLGHAAGDEMLTQIAKALSTSFPDDTVYRVGGDEFAVLCLNRSRQAVEGRLGLVQEIIRRTGYEMLSVGVAWCDKNIDPSAIVKAAEKNMREDKKRYYASPDRERQLRFLDEKTAQVFSRQRDMETFLTALAPQFKGVYFVNLEQDTIRHLFIPSYFERLLEEQDGTFSKGLIQYVEKLVKPEYVPAMKRLCDYGDLKARLDSGETPELSFEKKDGSWLQLRITRTEGGRKAEQETLWIFMAVPAPDGEE